MRQRRVVLTFPTSHGVDASLFSRQKVIEGLNVKFDIKVYGVQGQASECYVDIYNLNLDDLQFLTTSAATWLKKQTLMQLYAGYDNDLRMMFSGLIMDALPSGNPDVAVRIRAVSDSRYMGQTISFSKNNIKVFDLIKYAGEQMGYPINCPKILQQTNEQLNKVIDYFTWTGSPINLLNLLQEMCGGFDNDGKGVMLSAYNSQINIYSSDDNQMTSKYLINNKTGMIGYPELTGTGCNVRILLDTKLEVGQWVRIESERIPVSNRDYYITGIRHHGELRGQEFYTDLECSHNQRGI